MEQNWVCDCCLKSFNQNDVGHSIWIAGPPLKGKIEVCQKCIELFEDKLHLLPDGTGNYTIFETD
ncbi:MAG: hypothetical protein CMA60_05780 [Euryarchaeota archaeon]|nr:hypothetical protein [Euryarchaeota archaeon]